MENEQLAMFDVPPTTPKRGDKQKRNWENGFQRWSNKEAMDGSTPYGCCGYGSMCDYCSDNHLLGRPCIRALNQMCRERQISIDYSKRNYEDIWDGVF